jgi:hypothetical protein
MKILCFPLWHNNKSFEKIQIQNWKHPFREWNSKKDINALLLFISGASGVDGIFTSLIIAAFYSVIIS